VYWLPIFTIFKIIQYKCMYSFTKNSTSLTIASDKNYLYGMLTTNLLLADSRVKYSYKSAYVFYYVYDRLDAKITRQ
jgi:hypothetical protein